LLQKVLQQDKGNENQSFHALKVVEKTFHNSMIEIHCGEYPGAIEMKADQEVLARLRPRTLGGNRDWSASPIINFERSRQLRKNSNIAEKILWGALRKNRFGIKFRRQHPIGPYIADFYSRDINMVIEVDGEYHFTPEMIAYDKVRDEFMKSLGLAVIRVKVSEIFQDIDGVCEIIRNQCFEVMDIKNACWVRACMLEKGDVIFVEVPNQAGTPSCHSP